MAIFKKPAIKAEGGKKKKEIPRGLFQKCPGCSEVVPEIELAQNQRVCPRCDYHFAQPAKERIQNLLDQASLCFGPDKSDDRRRHGELRIAGRCHYCRTEKHDRFRGSSCYKGNHASGPTREISDCRVSRGARLIDMIVHRKKMREQVSRL